jgi:flagellar protein FliJ
MKKFKFKLETVLNVKERKEELLRHELMKLQALKLQEEQLLEEVKQQRIKISQEKAVENKKGTDIQSLRYFEQYLSVLLKKIDDTKKSIKALEKKADKKREEVVEASREKKVFEKLKEKQFDEFKRLVVQNEQKALDEMAVSKFNRKEQKSY